MSRRLYSLEPRDRTGVFLGMSAVECALVGGGFLLAIATRLAGAPVAVSVLALAAGAGSAKLRVAGRPVREWVPLLAGWLVARATGRRAWRAPLPLFPASSTATPLPPALRGVDVVEVDWRGPPRGRGARPAGRTAHRGAARDRNPVRQPGRGHPGRSPGGLGRRARLPRGRRQSRRAGGVVRCRQARPTPTSTSPGSTSLSATRARDDHAAVVGDPAGYRDLVDEIVDEAVVHDTVVWVTVEGGRVPGSGQVRRARRGPPARRDRRPGRRARCRRPVHRRPVAGGGDLAVAAQPHRSDRRRRHAAGRARWPPGSGS